MTTASPYFEVCNAEVYQQDYRVFEQLNVSLYLGQNSCILGPNGCGKSTLIKLLTRELYAVVKPESYVRWFGEQTCRLWQLRQQIGVVSQSLQERYDAHVLAENVVLSGLFGSVGIHGHFSVTDEQRQRAQNLMADLDLDGLQQRRYWHLSTGQQRRLLLARAVIHHPKVLILDEPTNGLDIYSAFEFIDHLRQLCQGGTTVLLVTHHIQEIIPEIDRVLIMQSGTIAHDGPKQQILTSDRINSVFNTRLQLVEQNGYFQLYPAANEV